MQPKERVLAALRGEKTDRVPVFCVNQTATYDQMKAVNAHWPEANRTAEAMAGLAFAGRTVLGFDAVRIPFCQTFEAEALGCGLKDGGAESLPSVVEHPYNIGDPTVFPEDFLERGRIPELLKAVRLVKERAGDEVAVIAGIIGPFSIATSLLGVKPALTNSFRKPQLVAPYVDLGERAGTALGLALIEAGADIICIEDMMASLDMISPKIYRELVQEREKKQCEALKKVPTVIHICGKLDSVIADVAGIGCTAISVETKVNIPGAKEKLAQYGRPIPLLGGVDPVKALYDGSPETVRKAVKEAMEAGYDIIAPGCSIPPAASLGNLKAMVEAVNGD